MAVLRLAAGAHGSWRRGRARRSAARDLRAHAASIRAPLAPVRGDRQEPPAGRDRARRRGRGLADQGSEVGAFEIAKRKGAGNVVELGSIAAFGFSPLWLLAAASDLTRGSRVYLKALEQELKAAGVIAEDVDAGSVDELLGVLERTSGGTARLIDIPPLELEGMRDSLAELRSHTDSLPSADELAGLYAALRRTAADEDRSLLEVSYRSGVGVSQRGPKGLRRAHRRALSVRTGSPCATKALPPMPAGSAGLIVALSRRHFAAEHPSRTERLLERFAEWRATRRARKA